MVTNALNSLKLMKISEFNLKNMQKTGKVRVRSVGDLRDFINFHSKSELIIIKKQRFANKVKVLVRISSKYTNNLNQIRKSDQKREIKITKNGKCEYLILVPS
ncbi:MAG: hypothetical protein ACP5OG_01985 [Candidatus Nanoarchaeia archaeon]